MSLPTPQYPLGDACSTLFNNTLYTYSSQAFQSLPIRNGATWSELPMGVAVTGGVCVTSTPEKNISAAALYIVGGTSNSSDYQGLQKYTFADGSWETLQPGVAITQNRLYHSAVYLNSSDSILVYAGTQDGTKQLSSQTFTIQASDPYLVTAYEAIAPPAINPLLIQWTESEAIYLGGSETNTKAMIFSPSTTWMESNATLKNPFYNTSNIKGVVINGDDGSKNLYTFDMTTSPNTVNRTILIDAEGNPVQNAAPVLRRRSLDERSFGDLEGRSGDLEKRGNLTVADWPAYNDTLASMSTRSTYSICRDQSGLVVISGGNEEDVLCMFKARDNSWVNATSSLVSNAKVSANGGLGSIATSTASTASTASATASPSSSSAPSTATNPKIPVKILGAVLGSIIGVALILLGILLLFRWRKKQRQHMDVGHQRRSSGISDEKDDLDFADRGLPQMSSARQFRNHEPQASQGSFSSMAILMGRVGGHRRGSDKGNGSLGSDSSSQFNKKYKNAISKPMPQEQPPQASHAFATATGDHKAPPLAEDRSMPPVRTRGNSRGGRRGSTRRSSGWNRYWSGGSAMNILGFGGSRRTTYEGSDRSSESQYSEYRLPSQATQSSAIVPPLKIGERPELNRVVSGSPNIAHTSNRFPLPPEMSGTIEKHGSMSSLSSFNDDDRHDAFSSGIPASVHEQQGPWTPDDKQDWAIGRSYSNAYTESNYDKTLPRNTRFPTGAPDQHPSQPPNKPMPDMSWLNLGGESRI
ncbi:hypothetical protein D0Z07_2526 [Hyphodiscus hymeniophilus]|uniref:Pre-mRNA splicing factor CLF1 n=1 Tax=Hyphodiscus hymeniophilus TaxID=353542 RepID=A0A9P6VN05_9HELO|nr:hypothetical protein D0Z07_2526 [Hyphodiscus hymeniophilus]